MLSFHRLWMVCFCLLPMPVWAVCGSAGVCPVAPDIPDNAVDEDGDGIKLYTVHLDPTGDTNFGAANDLTRVAMGWNETALVFEYEYRLQSNAIVWYFELGIPGGEDNFMFNKLSTHIYEKHGTKIRDFVFKNESGKNKLIGTKCLKNIVETYDYDNKKYNMTINLITKSNADKTEPEKVSIQYGKIGRF